MRHGKVYCEACGEEGICALDVHHDSMQVAYMVKAHITKVSDLRVLGATCHRKIHEHNITVQELLGKK